jgi:hypothetical protein
MLFHATSPSATTISPAPAVTGNASRSGGSGPASGSPRSVRKALSWAAAAVAGALTAVAIAITVTSGSAGAATAPRNWIGTGWNVHLAYQADKDTIGHFFNASTSFGTGPSNTANPVTDGLASSATMYYSSYAQFQSDLSSGAITYPYKWVMYDPEGWANTPAAEQKDPVRYLGLFAQLAHSKGYRVIETPARDLGNVATVCPLNTKTGENLDQWYVRCKIAAAAAAADVYVLQDQVNTTNLTEYAWLFNQARAQAVAASPSVQVDAEVSTNYGDASDMAAAAKSVPKASGFYVSMTSPSIAEAGEFFDLMQAAGY